MKKRWLFLSIVLPITSFLPASDDVDYDDIRAQMYLSQVQDMPTESANRITTLDVQQYQAEYDQQFFEDEQDVEKLRHILLHVMNSVGKLAAYCDVKEQGKRGSESYLLTNEVLPDLLMHSLQMANLFEVDLGAKYEQRIDANTKKITASRIIEALRAQ